MPKRSRSAVPIIDNSGTWEQRANQLAAYLTGAAHAGYVEEAIHYARKQYPTLTARSGGASKRDADLDELHFMGHVIKWSRIQKRYFVIAGRAREESYVSQ